MRRIRNKVFALMLCVCLIIPQLIGEGISFIKDTKEVYGAGPDSEPESGAHGSGSYQLNEVEQDNRFYTEYYVAAAPNKSYTTASVERRTTIRVYAKKDEIILFGSSVSNSEIDINNVWTKSVTGSDIVITTPNGDKISEDVILPGATDGDGNVRPRGYGYIANPTQEKYGPMVNHADESDPENKYYVPLRYTATTDGVYTFEFHSQTGYNDGVAPTPKKSGDKNWVQGKTTVAAWDVTVLGKKTTDTWEVKSGRAWADYLALTTGGAEGVVSDLDVNVLTHDGYIYNVKFEKASPFGFIFFANNTGFMSAKTDDNGHTTMSPIYHSFYDSTNDLDNMNAKENIYLHKPNEQDTDTEETYKIFFNRPSDDLNGLTYTQNGESRTIKTKPDDSVIIDNLKFIGIGENISRAGHGGVFSFESSGEAMITIRLDLRKAIMESEHTMDDYEGSGIVELTAPVHEGDNNLYWDGKDTEGVMIPAGIYGDQNVVMSTEVKRGELHFPVIDMEGLGGGLRVERVNKADTENLESLQSTAHNLYYNNNPLAYGTIEGRDYGKTEKNGYNVLSDGTNSFNIGTKVGGYAFFKDNLDIVSTLVKDDKYYLAKILYNTEYNLLSDSKKAVINAELGKEYDTFHFEPVDSSTTSMKFACSGYNGGGNQAGIDAWTYYSQGVTPYEISFAVLDSADRGIVKGQLFYDANKTSTYETGGPDYPLSNVKVRLIDSDGKPLEHIESLPSFDDTGHFEYDKDGSIIRKDQSVKYDTMTDAKGNYIFTGVPYDTDSNTTYYIQVMLTDVQTEVMRYTCTTSEDVKEKLFTKDATPVAFHSNTIDDTTYGGDGNHLIPVTDASKIYGHKYERDTESNETIFDKGNAKCVQEVVFDNSDVVLEHGIRVETFKSIGYCTSVPEDNRKDYKVVKNWGIDSEGNATHQISDGITVELWVWNDSEVKEENTLSLSRRTGALMDTQVLNEANGWTYTWKNLDDRLQYYVLEYYTKKKPNGEVIYNDKMEPRMVLIGGTMPIFGEVPAGKEIYGFTTNMGDYPETTDYTEDDGSVTKRIPIQSFAAGGNHANSITRQEKLESVENNARQYDVTYALEADTVNKTNIITINNSQVFDDRTYYVWLDHQTELPELISQSYVDDGYKQSHAITLEKDGAIRDGEYRIKGVSISSMDAASTENIEGNATDAFFIKENSKNALFTATNHGNYKSGTGTRTYQVKYVIEKATNKPVSVKSNSSGKLVLSDNEAVAVENNSAYLVYVWFMTIHVYDVKPDGIIEYDAKDGAINLQKSLKVGDELKWTLSHDKDNENLITYTSTDTRTGGLLSNDIYRVPLYKAADNPDMGSCADIVGIAYAGNSTVEDVSKLTFADTYETRYGIKKSDDSDGDGNSEAATDCIAKAEGSGGTVTVNLNVPRYSRINRVQDHANFVEVTFTPNQQVNTGRSTGSAETVDDVFYYKVVVFAEDSTYQFYHYEDIDASEGVVMYTYFTMRGHLPENPVNPDPVKPDPVKPDPVKPDPTTPEPTKPDPTKAPEPTKPEPTKPEPTKTPEPTKPEPTKTPEPTKPEPTTAPEPTKPEPTTAPESTTQADPAIQVETTAQESALASDIPVDEADHSESKKTDDNLLTGNKDRWMLWASLMGLSGLVIFIKGKKRTRK